MVTSRARIHLHTCINYDAGVLDSWMGCRYNNTEWNSCPRLDRITAYTNTRDVIGNGRHHAMTSSTNYKHSAVKKKQ